MNVYERITQVALHRKNGVVFDHDIVHWLHTGQLMKAVFGSGERQIAGWDPSAPSEELRRLMINLDDED